MRSFEEFLSEKVDADQLLKRMVYNWKSHDYRFNVADAKSALFGGGPGTARAGLLKSLIASYGADAANWKTTHKKKNDVSMSPDDFKRAFSGMLSNKELEELSKQVFPD